MRKLILTSTLVTIAFLMAFYLPHGADVHTDTNVYDVLYELGEPKPKHYIEVLDSAYLKMGEELVKNGRTTGPDGKKSKYISRFFVCTSCHNLEREDRHLTAFDPEERLDYVIEKDLPFLQGTTFWGIVNRESWYNDDYYLKYGENVKKANNDLREAIQLCAIECSQGRPLEQWEEDAILQYYWTLQLKMSDLEIGDELGNGITSGGSNGKNAKVIKELKSQYATRSPASFDYPPDNKFEGYGLKGDPERGKKVYDQSCLHCHMHQGVSDFALDQSTYSFQFLKEYMPGENQFSFYEVIRRGTYSQPGSRPYMPHYPKEKLSDLQIEDLRSYIMLKSN